MNDVIIPSLPALCAVAIPFVAAAIIFVTRGRVAELIGYIAAPATFACVAGLLGAVRIGGVPGWRLLEIVPGLALELKVDALGLTFALLASGLWVIATLYTSGYLRAEFLVERPRFLGCFAASIGTALGVAFSANLLTFLLFFELLTVATWPLVAHRETPEAIAGARKYLVYTLAGGLVLTAAVVWTWMLTGTLDFRAGGFVAGLPVRTLAPLFALFMIGCGVKAAIMPLHAWLPAAMVAPTPVSALLHAVAVVKVGVFGCLRVLGFVFGPAGLAGFPGRETVIVMTAGTIVIGSLMALRQDHLKRRLAYSTVVHLSYIVLGGALLTPFGLTGAVMHIVNHGLSKITLFFCAGSIGAMTHTQNISEMKGLGRRMPWTFGMFAVASLSLAGVPGLCGFVGKLMLGRGAVEAGAWVSLAIMIGASLLTAAYLLPVVWIAFFERPAPPVEGRRYPRHGGEAHRAMIIALVATAILTLVFGIVAPVIGVQYELARAVAAQVLGGTR